MVKVMRRETWFSISKFDRKIVVTTFVISSTDRWYYRTHPRQKNGLKPILKFCKSRTTIIRLKIYHSRTLLLASINEIEIQANRSYSQHNIYTFKYMCWERNLFIISSLPTPALRQEFCGTCGNWCPANADCGWVAIIQHVERHGNLPSL